MSRLEMAVGVLWRSLIQCMWVQVLCVGCVEVQVDEMGERVD